MSVEQLFKPYLMKAPEYLGGKGINEVKTKASKIFKLSSNENPIGTSPKANAAVQYHAQNLHVYPDRTGIRLQNALADFYQHELTTNHFVATNSGSESIEFIARAFIKEGLECIVSNPSFMPYTMFSGWNGGKVINIPLKEKTYELDLEGILTAVNDNTRLIFITSPNNPTGTYISKSTIDQLIEQLPDHVILVIDEVYYHFADAEDFTTAMPYVKAGKNVIAVNSFSKTYGLAAMRLGYMYSTPGIAAYLRGLYRPFLINKLGLEASIAALSDIDFLNTTVNLVKKERQRYYETFNQLGLTYWKSEANFILFQPPINAKDFEKYILEESGVMVRNATSFGATGCIRVTIGTEEANDAFLNGLKKLVD